VRRARASTHLLRRWMRAKGDKILAGMAARLEGRIVVRVGRE
jgi:hypothetical protein